MLRLRIAGQATHQRSSTYHCKNYTNRKTSNSIATLIAEMLENHACYCSAFYRERAACQAANSEIEI